ncbi:diacylglycerol kinase [Pasteurella canis]|uniref:Diacylglycerol kinase n=1 Tax=Pasteurella canis TaxID=753 RepID=A0A379EXB7_9PAST|nr:diacylglycerol kinase [Pasteurella canis]MXN88036.1 diacylglycerol kinase [Pasteurella canis]UAX42101.1 diacylglycerol kinase [Pasteurella canis]UAY77655.1 diacylglycerol kinase [Pasteurella canis]UDW83676.1 diacylglycerol kinase [Pasteurella canis]UEA16747.1 diacylglycerol kinase [Pasteurella canis]
MYKTTGLTHLIKATGYSLKGLKSAVKFETAFRHELFAALFLVPLAFWLAENGIEIAIMLGSLLLVLAFELVNSAIESVVDRVGLEHHELSGRAKDFGSAAVFIAMMNVLVVWAAVLIY